MGGPQSSYLFILSQLFSDVTLVIDGIKLPAHRAILSKGSEYFNIMFLSSFVEANSDKIILKGINLKAFKVVLEYIYDNFMFNMSRWTPDGDRGFGKLLEWQSEALDFLIDGSDKGFNAVFEILDSARYFMIDDLQKDAVSCVALATDPLKLLNYACYFFVDELILCSLKKIPNYFDSDNFTEEQFFQHLLPLTVKHILLLRLSKSEVFLFNALTAWMRNNLEYSYLFPELLDLIDLYLLDEVHLNTLFEPTYLINRILLQKMICDQWKRAQIVSKIENESVINEANKLRIVEKGFSSKTTESYFVVDLKQQFLLNRLKLKIYPSKSYAVCVSTDLHDWELVIDHSRHKCFGLQWLYFEERPVRFIRIHCDQSYNTYVKAFYSTIPFNFYIASPLTVRKLYETYAELKLLNGVTVRSNDSHYMQKRGDDILFQLSQPFYLTRIKLLLKKMSSYYIEISTNKENWTRVFEEEQVTGNRMAIFEKQPVSFIKIVGTHKVLNFFCLYKIEFS